MNAKGLAAGKSFASVNYRLFTFLFMSVFSQTFFTFVGGHFMPFSFFTAGHCKIYFWFNNRYKVPLNFQCFICF